MLIQDQCTWVLILHLVHLADGLKRERENTINLVYVPVADVLPSDETDEEADDDNTVADFDYAGTFSFPPKKSFILNFEPALKFFSSKLISSTRLHPFSGICSNKLR